ncbi:MAG: nucleotidyltransferase [Clostridia bacterium]|nr:nucleotidyltransferase [Clostridia bacterium]
MILVILAGGLGSRFGAAKQIEGIDKNNNFILDYSIYDAIKSGFDKVVVIVKPEHKHIFENTLAKRLGNKIKVEFAEQTTDEKLLEKFNIKREKPLGTAHALLCAEKFVDDNFCIVNADDFYGRNSFKVAGEFLKTAEKSTTNYALVGFELCNTLSETGSVKRGVCETESGFVNKITECKVSRDNGKISACNLETDEIVLVEDKTPTSMNMFCLTPKFFEFLNLEYEKFISEKENVETKEFLLPTVVNKAINLGLATLKVLETNESWIGMTYKEDKKDVIGKIQKLVDNKIYPENLWS